MGPHGAAEPARGRLDWRGAGPARTVVVHGVNAVVRAAAKRLALFSELSELSELSGLDGVETLLAKGAGR